VEVRRLAPADLAAFQAGMPAWNATEYAKRIGFQKRRLAVQLVAWAGEEPAGRAMVVFPGHPEWSPSAYREGCPEIRDLGVAPAWRRRGIATALVAAAERETRSAGFPRLGLGVGIDDDDAAARSLYERLGYVFAHGPFVHQAWYWRSRGSIHEKTKRFAPSVSDAIVFIANNTCAQSYIRVLSVKNGDIRLNFPHNL